MQKNYISSEETLLTTTETSEISGLKKKTSTCAGLKHLQARAEAFFSPQKNIFTNIFELKSKIV